MALHAFQLQLIAPNIYSVPPAMAVVVDNLYFYILLHLVDYSNTLCHHPTLVQSAIYFS